MYNRITEICFSACVDNLSTRKCTNEESQCVDNCFRKFSNVNQRLLSIYVEQQAEVNKRRANELAELEKAALLKQQQEQAALQQGSASNLPEVSDQTSNPSDYIRPEDVPLSSIGSEKV